MNNDKKANVHNVIDHLNEKWGVRHCPMCGENSWTVSDTIYELREFQGGNVVIGGGPIYPIIPVSCNNCGNSIMVNAIQSGGIENPNVQPNQNIG